MPRWPTLISGPLSRQESAAGRRSAASQLDDLAQAGLSQKQGQGGGAVADLVGAGHGQHFRQGVDFDEFGRFVLGLPEGDVAGDVDVGGLVADAVGGVEVAGQ